MLGATAGMPSNGGQKRFFHAGDDVDRHLLTHFFKKQSVGLFIADQVKTFSLIMVLGMPALAALIVVIKAGGDSFYIYAWGLSCALIFFFLTIYPNLIAPLFNKFSPLEDGPLKEAIENLARENKFPLQKLYVVDGSTRSSHSNAYFYGFGSQKRIVLYDTLSKALLTPSSESSKSDKSHENGCTKEEIVAILAHELGHWKLWHTFCNLAIVQVMPVARKPHKSRTYPASISRISQVGFASWRYRSALQICCPRSRDAPALSTILSGQVHLFCFFFFLGGMLNSESMYASFGFQGRRAVILGLILFSNIIAPIEHLLQFLMNLLSRRFEYQVVNACLLPPRTHFTTASPHLAPFPSFTGAAGCYARPIDTQRCLLCFPRAGR